MTLFSLINLSLFRYTYSALAAFAKTIHDGFIAQVADYAAPNPTMILFKTHIDNLNAAIAAWGIKGNRGSHTDHLALIAAAVEVKNDLRMLADYAQNEQPNNPDSWALVGFSVKRPKSPPKALEVVQNLRHFIARNIPSPNIKLKWKRPLNTTAGDVKGYLIQRSNSSVYPLPPLSSQGIVNVIGIVPNTSFIDNDPLVGDNWYWVTPFNSLGLGVTSDPLLVVSTKPASE
jgi:hypothetical protein